MDNGDPAGGLGSSLSYEEFKKSLIRIASICNVTKTKKRMDPSEVFDDQDRLLETTGGDAPEEWDEHGNPVKYKTIITLKKKVVKPTAQAAQNKDPQVPTKLYDISKLKLERFH